MIFALMHILGQLRRVFIFQTTLKMNQPNNYLKNYTSIHSGKI